MYFDKIYTKLTYMLSKYIHDHDSTSWVWRELCDESIVWWVDSIGGYVTWHTHVTWVEMWHVTCVRWVEMWHVTCVRWVDMWHVTRVTWVDTSRELHASIQWVPTSYVWHHFLYHSIRRIPVWYEFDQLIYYVGWMRRFDQFLHHVCQISGFNEFVHQTFRKIPISRVLNKLLYHVGWISRFNEFLYQSIRWIPIS